jgi:hypothetical protein
MKIINSIFLALFVLLKTPEYSAGEQEIIDKNIEEKSEAIVYPNCISVPIARILLARDKSGYCEIKFINGGTTSAEYISYYQPDNTGKFNKKNVEIKNGKLISKEPVGIGRFAFSFGQMLDIECGPLKLMWSGRSSVYFHSSTQDKQREIGVELAPTPWTDISQVNVFDRRIKWYWYDEKRRDIFIPIDKLWPEAEAPAQPGPTKP